MIFRLCICIIMIASYIIKMASRSLASANGLQDQNTNSLYSLDIQFQAIVDQHQQRCNYLNLLYGIIWLLTGRSAVRLARLLWEQEVPGSNPGAPTISQSTLEHHHSILRGGVFMLNNMTQQNGLLPVIFLLTYLIVSFFVFRTADAAE